MRTPQEAMTLAEELQQLRAENKKRAKKIARLKELNEFLEEASAFSRRAVGSREKRTIKVHSEKDRRRVVKGKISFYCEALKVSQQAFYDYLGNRNKPWKHERIAGLISDIIAEDECNDTYGRGRIYASLKLQYPRTHGISGNGDHRCGPSEKPKAKRNNQSGPRSAKIRRPVEAQFYSRKILQKCVTDITEIPAKNGKLYVSTIFDCYDLFVAGLAMADNMRTELCVQTVDNVCKSFGNIRGMIIHSNRGSQYTSENTDVQLWVLE